MKWLKSILFAVVFFNPIVLLILFKSYWIAVLIPLAIILGGHLISQVKTFRLTVWFFNIFAIIGIALTAELVFRELYADKSVPNIYEVRGNYYFNKPNLNQRFDDEEFNAIYRTNCQGYRIDLLSNETDSIKQCDWLFIGDSFTQGAQVNYDQMFTSLLYRYLPDKVIVNAGMSGAGLYESLNYLKDEGKKLKPKKIFLQIGAFNDFYNIKERHAGWSEYLMEYSDLYRYLQYNILDNPTLPLGRWTEPFFEHPEENAKFNIFYKESSQEKRNDEKAFEEVMRTFKQQADDIGAELIVFLIPSKEQTSDNMLEEVIRRFGISRSELDMQAPNNLTASVCHNLGITLIDLYEAFRDNEDFPFFMRDEHLNAYGHRLVADELKKAMKPKANEYISFSSANNNERYPTFFDCGMSVLYQSQLPGLYQIKTSNVVHGREDAVWSSNKPLIHPVISPDGTWLAFTEGDQDHGDTDVILYNRVIERDDAINPKGFHGAIPSFSHNSKLIAYPKWRDNENPVVAVYDVTEAKELFSFGDKETEVWRPVFSPDDSLIYYIKMGRNGNFAIWQYELSTKQSSQVLQTPFNIWDIAVSPSGNKIAFAGNKNGNWDLFIYDLSTAELSQLTNSLGNEWDPIFYSENELWFAGEFGINNGIFHITLQQ